MSNVNKLIKAMEIPGALDEEGLLQVRKDWFDPLVLEQHKMDAAGAFDGDSFRLPRQLIWEDKFNARLPVFLKDFVHEMHCVDFQKMTPSTRRTLWFGVRLGFGLSESDFPYPEKLKDLDLPKSKNLEKASDLLDLSISDPSKKYRLPVTAPAVAALSFFLGMIVALMVFSLSSRHHASHAGHVPSVPSANSGPDSLSGVPQRQSLPPAPKKNVPGAPALGEPSSLQPNRLPAGSHP